MFRWWWRTFCVPREVKAYGSYYFCITLMAFPIFKSRWRIKCNASLLLLLFILIRRTGIASLSFLELTLLSNTNHKHDDGMCWMLIVPLAIQILHGWLDRSTIFMLIDERSFRCRLSPMWSLLFTNWSLRSARLAVLWFVVEFVTQITSSRKPTEYPWSMHSICDFLQCPRIIVRL